MNVPSRAPRLALFGPPRESVLGRRGRTRWAGGAEGPCVDGGRNGRFSSHLQRPFTPSVRCLSSRRRDQTTHQAVNLVVLCLSLPRIRVDGRHSKALAALGGHAPIFL